MNHVKNDAIRNAVREQYRNLAESQAGSCCSSQPSCCNETAPDAKTVSMELGYSSLEVNEVPEGANMGLGCGNPKAIASLQPGEVVLDLGSGGGFDCFLAAREVGPTGKVIGVDMTPEMISKARVNAEQSEFETVEFRLGEIEHLPVADAEVDVILSNCVINLSPEKPQVFQEAFRVLKPGGRLAISDVVATTDLPTEAKADMKLYAGCLSGASSIAELETMLRQAGFENIRIQPKDESRSFIEKWAPGSQLEDYVVSATIEAIKLSA